MVLIPVLLALTIGFAACKHNRGEDGEAPIQSSGGSVSLSGNAIEESTLTVIVHNLRGTFIYTWLSGDTFIHGADSRNYTIRADDIGKIITVQVAQQGYEGVLTAKTAPVTALTRHTVTFMNEGQQYLELQNVAYGRRIDKPADPVHQPVPDTDFIFLDWHKVENADAINESNLWNFNTDTVTSDIELHAHWTDKTKAHAITFYLHEGDLNSKYGDTQLVQGGEKVGEPPEPSKADYEGHNFEYWYSRDSNGTLTQWTFTDGKSDLPVSAPRDLYAQWVRFYTLAFDTDGGDPIAQEEVQVNESYGKKFPHGMLPVPTHSDEFLQFAHWHNTATNVPLTGKSELLFLRDFPTEDIILKAKWIRIYRVTFDPNDGMFSGGENGIRYIDEGKSFASSGKMIPNNPTKPASNQPFRAWTTDKDDPDTIISKTEIENRDFTAHTTYYALWHLPRRITFMLNLNAGEDETYATRNTFDTLRIPLPPEPENVSQIFTGWWTKNGEGSDWGDQWYTTTLLNPKGSIDDNLPYDTLYARWEPKVKVTFVSNSSAGDYEVFIRQNGKVSKPVFPDDFPGSLSSGVDPDKLTDWHKNGVSFNFDTPITEETTLYAKWTFTIPSPGNPGNPNPSNPIPPLEKGPGGGDIFYHNPDGFKVYQGNAEKDEDDDYVIAYYLEVGPELGQTIWSPSANISALVATSYPGNEAPTMIGRGKKNTRFMMENGATGNSAAGAAASYRGDSNLSDWFLPTSGELKVLRALGTTGTTTYYWCSEQTLSGNAFAVDFSGAAGKTDRSKNTRFPIRPVRAF